MDGASPRQILEFYAAAGIDITLGDAPVNRLAPTPEAAYRAAAPVGPHEDAARSTIASIQSGAAEPRGFAGSQQNRPAPPAPDEAAHEARERAASAPDLATLEQLLDAFQGSPLKAMASRLVFADGNPAGRVMIVGEAPGREEDETGKPFVGRAGRLLDRMLAAIGLDRTGVYIANVVPWRPPGNRTPTPQEIAVLAPFIRRQIELADPDILVTMGAPATQNLLNQREGILRLRGRWFEYETGRRTIPALATLHPAYLLRQPAQKALAWRDLRALKSRLEGTSR
jgi:DNA polymerase